jgi:DNA-binding Lrp family transcriptional regulator
VWQTSYSHFKTKFNLSHETVRRSLVRLEELGIIVREFRTVCVKGQAYNNRLFVKLNEDCKSSFFMPSEEDPCPQIGGEHIENNKTKNLNNRSTEQSKFFKNSDLEQLKEVVDETMATKEVSLADSNFSERQAREQIEDDANLDGQSHRKKFIPLINKKPLSHFYPLSEEDCKALRFESGREFSRNFINQLWGRVRSRVIEYYNRSGKEGECIDRHWFSKLDPEVNEEHRQISLKAPTSFIRDWVQTNYLRVIEEFCQQESYELTGLVVG